MLTIAIVTRELRERALYNKIRDPQFASLHDSSTMPSTNRSAGRNVHIYNANEPNTVLGGLYVNDGVTNANFYSMLDFIFIFSGEYLLRDGDGNKILKDSNPLQPNKYYIVTQGRFIYLQLF
jgi:hypothetical protein